MPLDIIHAGSRCELLAGKPPGAMRRLHPTTSHAKQLAKEAGRINYFSLCVQYKIFLCFSTYILLWLLHELGIN
jgi:hypothetical protein